MVCGVNSRESNYIVSSAPPGRSILTKDSSFPGASAFSISYRCVQFVLFAAFKACGTGYRYRTTTRARARIDCRWQLAAAVFCGFGPSRTKPCAISDLAQ